MIEINLIPDVKLELLKARRQRKMVISGSILLSIVAAGVVTLLSFYAFGVQTVADSIAQANINGEIKKLEKVEDLAKTLTIQNQLAQIDQTQRDKTITSRLFDLDSATRPTGNNAITIKRMAFDDTERTIKIEGESFGGYEALEVYKKTILQTKFKYEGLEEPRNVVETFADGERKYAEDNDGRRVLRFTQSFSFPDELFSPESRNLVINGPTKQRATDSIQGVPTSLFDGGEN